MRPTPFARAHAMFAAISAALASVTHTQPLERQMAIARALRNIGPYRSRGKGRGTASRRYGNDCNNAGRNRPHQGWRECERRRLGGFYNVAARFHDETVMR